MFKQGEVILFKSIHPSFTWNDGLFAILQEIDHGDNFVELKMVKLVDGNPQVYDHSGKYMITCTGSNNKGISKTKLTFDVNQDLI